MTTGDEINPSRIAARARGELPTDQEPGSPTAEQQPLRSKGRRPGTGANPMVVLAGAFALGIALAKLIDWRSHAHPRI